ncbi:MULTISPECIES: ATP-binding cassette domain-containing protein [unclassified Microbacterium]|uniref:ATP-binding cassette domain-containing protein n=1 Tax=unclassified Microbacterium TaxID=2609290 RepID=UPI00342A29F9
MSTAAEAPEHPPVADPPAELRIEHAWKSFGHVSAVRDVSLHVAGGEVLAIVGDNGAGKSTLVKLLSGVYPLDSGELFVNGERIEKADPRRARSHGVSTVFQDLAIVETLDIAANMFLGQPLRRFGLFADRKQMLAQSAEILRDLQVRIPSVRVPAGELSGGQRQGVAIARAVRQDNPIILMDEPTAALGVRETAQVAEIIRTLKGRGKAVILVCHDLEFIFEVADRIHVLRLGATQGVRSVASTDRSEVVALITGAMAADDEPSGDGTSTDKE